jgi:hypothetical protein
MQVGKEEMILKEISHTRSLQALESANGSDSKYWSTATNKREESVAEPLLRRALRRIFNAEIDKKSAQCPHCDIAPYVKIGFLQAHLSNQHGEDFTVAELEALLRHRVSPGQLHLAGGSGSVPSPSIWG